MIEKPYTFHYNFNKLPTDTVIGFVHIKFQCPNSSFTFFPHCNNINNLIAENDIIRYCSAFNEGNLVRGNNIRQDKLKPINYRFGNDFISHIAQADRLVMGNSLDI